MLKRSSQVLCLWFLMWDLVVTACAWVGAYYIRFLSGWIPLVPDSPLWTMPNVIITPHNSSTGTGNYRRGVEIFR